MNVILSVTVPMDAATKLQKLCDLNKKTVAKIIREIILEYLKTK